MKSILIATLTIILTISSTIAKPLNLVTINTVSQEKYLFEVVRHLYCWYLDETDAEKLVGKDEILFKIKELTPHLDDGDKSKFCDILIPQLDIRVTVKQSDYTIEELDLMVKNDTFKIINVARGGLPEAVSGYTTIKTDYQAIRDYTHRTRSQVRFPDDKLLVQMRKSARAKIIERIQDRKQLGLKNKITNPNPLKKHDLAIHISSLAPVANEVWIFWESGRLLIHFKSDLDFEQPELWNNDNLAVKLYDIDEQTVVSLDDVAGSNAYITRDQVGRTLFNCIVLGKRIELEPIQQ